MALAEEMAPGALLVALAGEMATGALFVALAEEMAPEEPKMRGFAIPRICTTIFYRYSRGKMPNPG